MRRHSSIEEQRPNTLHPREKIQKLGQQTTQTVVRQTLAIDLLHDEICGICLHMVAPEEHTHANSFASVERNQMLNVLAKTCKTWHGHLVPEVGAPHASIARKVTINALDVNEDNVCMKSWWVKLRIVGAISAECMRAIIHACPLMQALDVEATSAFSVDIPNHPMRGVRLCQLTTLNLDYCRWITDASMCTIVGACPRLAYLCVTYCDKLTDKTLFSLATLKGTLHHLILSCCQKFTGDGVAAITKMSPNLRCIDLSYCDRVDEYSLGELAKCKYLERIQISGCTKVTDACIAKIALGCRRVHRLHVASCYKLTNATLETVVSTWPSVRDLRIFGCSMTDYKVRNLPTRIAVNTTQQYSYKFF